MDYTASQQIANIVHDMEPEDALTALLAQIRNLDGVIVKAWVADDIDGVLDDLDPDFQMTTRQRATIKDDVLGSGTWENLANASDADWMLINIAIQDALTARGWVID